MPIPALLLMLSFCGFLISFYFTLVRYKLMSPEPSFLPRFCRLDKRSCDTILSTPEARILGLPNSLFGMAYYLAIMSSLFAPQDRKEIVVRALCILSVCSVLIGGYLIYSLLFKLKIPVRPLL